MKTTELYDHLEHLQAELDSVTRFEKERSLIAVAEECERRARELRSRIGGLSSMREDLCLGFAASEFDTFATDLRKLAG